MSEYTWTDNPTQSGIATCDTDVLNDDLMHLKYNNSSRIIGEIIQSTLPLTDAGLHLLNGEVIGKGGSYAAFVDYIAEIYTNSIYRNFLFTTEADWQTSVNTYGVCGKFVYTPDSTETYYAWYSSEDSMWYYTASATPSANDNYYHIYDGGQLISDGIVSSYSGTQITLVSDFGHTQTAERDSTKDTTLSATVRLPKITGFTEGAITPFSLGDLVEAGLPNITGGLNSSGSVEWLTTNVYGFGAFTRTGGSSSNATGSASGSRGNQGFGFDASRSSSIYGNSSTVQPQAIKVLYYIVIATSAKQDIEIDIDKVATDLNNKAGTDLVNINDTGEKIIVHNTMLSGTYKDLTFGASGTTYTAPTDGWVYFFGNNTGSGGCYFLIENTTKGYSKQDQLTSGYGSPNMLLPVSKGDIYQITYQNVSSNKFRFYYDYGTESEAS